MKSETLKACLARYLFCILLIFGVIVLVFCVFVGVRIGFSFSKFPKNLIVSWNNWSNLATCIAAVGTFITAIVIYFQLEGTSRQFSLTSIQNAFFSLYDGARLRRELRKIKDTKMYNLKKENIPTIIAMLDLLRLNFINRKRMDSVSVNYYIRLLLCIVKEEKLQKFIICRIYAGYLCAKGRTAEKERKAGYGKFLKQILEALDRTKEWDQILNCFKSG